MAGLALAAWVVYVLVAFGWRTWLQVRRTGESGFRGFSGGGPGRVAGALLMAGGLASFLAPIADLLGLLQPAGMLARPSVQIAGLLVAALAIVLTTLAQLQMGDSWRIGIDPKEATELVTHGLFRSVRNPIFSGMLLAVASLALLVPNLLSLLGAVLVALGLELHVRRVEEPHLIRVHGARYREYAGSVGRFFPGVGCLR